jgi:hypothetical protein
MQIYKTIAAVEGEGLSLIDTIEYDYKLWLVPEWIDGWPTEGYSMPIRIICLEYMPLVGPLKGKNHDYCINGSISKSLLDGHPKHGPEVLCQIVERPDIIVGRQTEQTHH